MVELHKYSTVSTENVYLNAAAGLGIPFERITGRHGFWILGNEENRIHLTGNMLGVNTMAGSQFTKDKAASQAWLQKHGLPVPPFMFHRLHPSSTGNLEELMSFISKHYPIVVKASSSSLGRNVYTDIRNEEELMRVLAYQFDARQLDLIIEKYIEGQIYRVIVFDDEVIDVACWTLSLVTGDGSSTIRELIDALNESGRDGRPVAVNARLVDLLYKQGQQLDSVLDAGTIVQVVEKGGTRGCRRKRISLSQIPQENLECFRKTQRVCGLRLLGIDLICTDVTVPWQQQTFYMNEVNSSPGMSLSYLETEDNDLAPATHILKKIFRID